MITNKSDRWPIVRDYIYLCCINYVSDNPDVFFMIMDWVLMSLPCVECYWHFEAYIKETSGIPMYDYHDTLKWAYNLNNKIRERQWKELITKESFKKYIKSMFPSLEWDINI